MHVPVDGTDQRLDREFGPADQRASANALGVFAIHCLGDVPSPWLIGKLSDVYSLAQAVKIVPLAIMVSAGIWVWAARRPALVRRRR